MHTSSRQPSVAPALAALSLLATATLTSLPVQAQSYPVTPAQRATAQRVANAGVPLSELAPNAPDEYVVRRGDTLWGISKLYLKSPWRWPELWGMNLQEIHNPHQIYPGQQLYLDKADGRARLRSRAGGNGGAPQTVKLSPHARAEGLTAGPVPTLDPRAIEPFLAEPLVVDEATLQQAPRIVATQEDRVLLSRNDRAYARGETPLSGAPDQPTSYRVFRNANPLKDPYTGEVLGYEAQYVGQVELVRGEGSRDVVGEDGSTTTSAVPATVDIRRVKEEIRVGDRMLTEPPRQSTSYTPHEPSSQVEASVVSVYGSAVRYAAQNQVIAINRGTRDGMEVGHVLTLLKAGARVVDQTDPARPLIQLPDERNGLGMVFRTFERVSYVLILDIVDGVKVGDRLVNPR